jgi:hypothetical protein
MAIEIGVARFHRLLKACASPKARRATERRPRRLRKAPIVQDKKIIGEST